MKKKTAAFTAASAVLAGAGTAAFLAKQSDKKKKRMRKKQASPIFYRNTELGAHKKNSKGIYYSSGNYEAFARPEKPKDVDEKNAYIVGSGLAALAAACFLVRDGQMPGSHIHILEALDIAGGACDGIFDSSRGYIMRGGREMEDHFECLWDLFRSIPSLEKAGVNFRFNTEVTNVVFEFEKGKKTAVSIECKTDGIETRIPLTEKDLVFVTNGSCTEGTIYGDQNHAPDGNAWKRTSGCWSLWKNIARQDPSFGRPEKFCSDISKTNWESARMSFLTAV